MSLISKTANIDSLVAEMSAALEDKDFRSVFERPVIRTASDEGMEKKASAVTPETLLETLLATSAHLDELGFSKSAEEVLSVAQSLVAEAQFKEKEQDPRKGMVGPGESDPTEVGLGGSGASSSKEMPVMPQMPKMDHAGADDGKAAEAKRLLTQMGLKVNSVTEKDGCLHISVVPNPSVRTDDLEAKLSAHLNCEVKLTGGTPVGADPLDPFAHL